MLSTREAKIKIRSINNTKQITKAMEMVSASKMRRSQQVALGSRFYCEKALQILGNLSEHTDYNLHPLLKRRPVNKVGLLVIASDKGLCGGLNANVLKKAQKFLEALPVGRQGERADVIAVGKRARDFFLWRKINIAESFIGFGDSIKIEEMLPIADSLIKWYQEQKYDSVTAVYTKFFSTLKQEAVVRQILPINIESIKEIVAGILPERGRYSDLKQSRHHNYEYLYEPSSESVLNNLLPDLFRIQIYHMILESNASEHSARMVAMRNASDSAQKLIEELTLYFNKARQSAITKEISEITAGAEALQ
ncbi:MAG: ATP synthase F1 subunit gamma [bacterium]|nr:ATP synthase F1 subunit gamma [bacterium]